ncbi:hypothetical protein V1523DRAFT_411398 [Lipomyces doorenjongii]
MVLLLTSTSESSSALQGMIRADKAAAAVAAQDAFSDSIPYVSKILDTTVHVVEPEKLIYNDDDDDDELDVVDVDECSGDSSRDETENVGSFGTGFDDSMTTHYPNDSEAEVFEEDLDDVPEMADDTTTDISETRKIILTEYDMDESTEAEPMHDNREAKIADYDDDAEEDDAEEDDQEEDDQEEDDRFELSSSPSIQDESDIDLSLVYALHTFKATQNGHADAVKGDAMVLLDDSNEYWWLVRMIKDSTVGYLPAEKIETPSERLARLNKHRNIDIVADDVPSMRTSSERSRNPLKRFRSNKATAAAPLITSNKTVSFATPTFYDPPEGYYISDDEGEMGDEDSETDEDDATDEEMEQEQENDNVDIVQEVVITDQAIEHASEGIEEIVEITELDITHTDDDDEHTLDADSTLRDDMVVDNASAYTDMHIDVAVDPYAGDVGVETLHRDDDVEIPPPNTDEDTTTFLDAQSMPTEDGVSSAVEQAAADEIRVGIMAVEPALSHATSIPRSKYTMQLSAIAFEGGEEPAAGSPGSSAATSMTYRAPSPSSYKTQRHVFQHPPSHASGGIHQSAQRSSPDAQSPPSSTPTTSGLPPVLRQLAATPTKAVPVPDTREHRWTASSRTKLRRKEPNGLLNTKSSLDKLSLRYRINGANAVLGNIFKKKTSQSSTSLESSESNATMQTRPSVSSEETSVRSRTPSALSVSVRAVEGGNSEVQHAAGGSSGEQKEDKERLRPSFDQILARRSRTTTYDSMYSDASTAIMQPFAGYGGYEPETESLNERKYSSVDDNLDAIDGAHAQDDTVTTEATQDDTFYSTTNLLAGYRSSNTSDDGASTIGSSTDGSGARDSSSRSSPPQERNAAFERHSDDDIDADQQAPADEDLLSLMLHAASRNDIVHPALASSFRDATRVVDLTASKLDALLFQWWDARREASAPSML